MRFPRNEIKYSIFSRLQPLPATFRMLSPHLAKGRPTFTLPTTGKILDFLFYSNFFYSSPSWVIRENAVPNATVSTYFLRLVHCHQPLHTCPPGGSSFFLCDLPPASSILCFRRPTDVSTYLSYRSLFYHKYFLPFFTHVYAGRG